MIQAKIFDQDSQSDHVPLFNTFSHLIQAFLFFSTFQQKPRGPFICSPWNVGTCERGAGLECGGAGGCWEVGVSHSLSQAEMHPFTSSLTTSLTC